ncbi:50S ribosomal protein L18 [bacterium]|jgi:large subunit ribosomal protein L18|nr:50S ribosomal protein L18 [bacterium]NBW56429.1 50S ribosomal protein L18 [bacterium]NBX71702.1 50S ribosomal protein L18 [bacterium]
MHDKKKARLRRAAKTRYIIKRQVAQVGRIRLTIYRSSQHIYGMVLDGGKVLAHVSTLNLRDEAGTKTEKASQVGRLLAQQALTNGVTKVACDRSGFAYHGRVKALVEAFRQEGIEV